MLGKFQLTLWDLIRSKKSSPKVTRKRQATRADKHLSRLWIDIRKEWFPDRPELDKYLITWSNRPQKRTLASCNIKLKKVTVARELNYPKYHHHLEPLLYHEMCHAALGFIQKKGYRSWHGKEFKTLEKRHPEIAELDAWIKSGGWLTAVRSDRGKRAYQKRIS